MNQNAYLFPVEQKERLSLWLQRCLIKGMNTNFSQKTHNFELGEVKTFLEDQNPNFKDYDKQEQLKQIRAESKKIENHYVFLKRLIKVKGVIGYSLSQIDEVWKEQFQYSQDKPEWSDGITNYLEQHATEFLR